MRSLLCTSAVKAVEVHTCKRRRRRLLLMMGTEEWSETGGPTLPPCENIESENRRSASLIPSLKSFVCPSAKSHYMHLPCLRAAPFLNMAFSPDHSILIYSEEPSGSRFHVSQHDKSQRGAQSLSSRKINITLSTHFYIEPLHSDTTTNTRSALLQWTKHQQCNTVCEFR